jgi:hypothetical protein
MNTGRSFETKENQDFIMRAGTNKVNECEGNLEL